VDQGRGKSARFAKGKIGGNWLGMRGETGWASNESNVVAPGKIPTATGGGTRNSPQKKREKRGTGRKRLLGTRRPNKSSRWGWGDLTPIPYTGRHSGGEKKKGSAKEKCPRGTKRREFKTQMSKKKGEPACG